MKEYTVLSLFGRCGSLFLHSLFDGHSQYSTIPGIAPYQLLAELTQIEEQRPLSPALIANIAKRFTSIFNDPFLLQDAGLDRLGPHHNEPLHINPQAFFVAFTAALSDTSVFSLPLISDALHIAFDHCLNLTPRPRIFLELHTIAPGATPLILQRLRRFRHILLVREPVDNVESCINYLLMHKPVQPHRLSKFYRLILGMLAFQAGHGLLSPNTLAIRFEDVKSQPEPLLRRLCAQLDLAFEPVLLQSTYLQKTYHSAPTVRNPGISGFAPHRSNPDGYRLSPADADIFRALFRHIGEQFHYTVSKAGSLADPVAILLSRPLDVETDFFRLLGISSTPIKHPEALAFRQQLAQLTAQFCLAEPVFPTLIGLG